MQVTENFSMAELLHSNTAVRLGLSNQPTQKTRRNIIEACTQLYQPMREVLGKSVLISSGYRSPAVNKAVGGSATSAHMNGYAIDFISPKYGTPYQIAKYLSTELKKRGIKFDQIILEFNSWVHIGFKTTSGAQRGQLLTAKKINGKTQYLAGIIQ